MKFGQNFTTDEDLRLLEDEIFLLSELEYHKDQLTKSVKEVHHHAKMIDKHLKELTETREKSDARLYA